MKRRCLKTGGRERAFWGALISTIGSLVGTGLSMAAQNDASKRAIEEQKRLRQRELAREQSEQSARTINNYFSSLSPVEEEYAYANGGKRKLRRAGAKITDGGYAIPLDNNTSLLRGSLHSQVNESGNTGIGIKVGNKEIEAEDGEVIQKKGNELRVFSAQPMLDGVSPAQAVIEGANNDKVFKAQEAIKKRYNLRNGKSTPVERNKALWGATFTTPDHLALGTNIAGSLLSGIYGSRGYDDLINSLNYSLPSYVDETYVAGPTRVYDDAKKAAIRRNDINSRHDIFRNTASSNVAVDRSQEVGTNAMYELMKVADETENRNIELRQANAERQQQARARNAAARNEYYRKVTEIRNQQLATKLGLQQSRLNNNVAMIQGIGSSIGGFLQSGIDNYQADQARRMQLAASPYGTAERMSAMGVDFSRPLMRSLSSEAESRIRRFSDDNSNSGIKSYNDALDSYNYWNNMLGLRGNSYSRRSLSNVGVNTVKRWDWAAGDWR